MRIMNVHLLQHDFVRISQGRDRRGRIMVVEEEEEGIRKGLNARGLKAH